MAMQNNGTNRLRRAFRKGFSLIELLVVITLNSILLALLLPTVQMAQEAVHKSQGKNNLKQIEPRLHNFHDAQGILPHLWKSGPRQTTIPVPGRDGSPSRGTAQPDPAGLISRALVTRSEGGSYR